MFHTYKKCFTVNPGPMYFSSNVSCLRTMKFLIRIFRSISTIDETLPDCVKSIKSAILGFKLGLVDVPILPWKQHISY